ncbi:MAG: hypothetical protein HYX88_03465 [Chloroflexi bacterium]|nr:hypothetical protein [Chloroflexota bacterium]
MRSEVAMKGAFAITCNGMVDFKVITFPRPLSTHTMAKIGSGDSVTVKRVG